MSQKEKKIDNAQLDLSQVFRGTEFASVNAALTISSPETTASVPKQRPGYLNRRLPTAVPTRSPAVLFLPDNRRLAPLR
jgi:hypothetical protein